MMKRRMEEVGLGKFVEDKSRCGFIKTYPLLEAILQEYKLNPTKFEEISKGIITTKTFDLLKQKWGCCSD